MCGSGGQSLTVIEHAVVVSGRICNDDWREKHFNLFTESMIYHFNEVRSYMPCFSHMHIQLDGFCV